MKTRFFAILLVLFATSVAMAQTGSEAGPSVLVEPTASAPTPAPNWGVSAETAAVVASQAFMPPVDTLAYSNTQFGLFQTTTTSQPDWWAPVYVPSGAFVTHVQFQACDTTATGNLVFGLARFNSPAQTGQNITTVGSTGLAATPGCAFFDLPVLAPFNTQNMNNGANYLLLFVGWRGTFTGANTILAVRVFYKLQVSPGPAIATFTDVSNASPIYKFVEALAASGITGGCGGGNYCPDSPVTRGQMAVFLSAALGLHWTP